MRDTGEDLRHSDVRSRQRGDIAAAVWFSDRVGALYRGRVAAFDPIDELRRRAATEKPLAELFGGLDEGNGP